MEMVINMSAATMATVRQALLQHRGDDAIRARMAFGRFTEKEMDLMHGESGKSRRQILAEYEAHERRVNEALLELGCL